MKIRRLVLDHVACFEHLDLTFEDGGDADKADVHIFVGPNGAGKSSVLMAAAQFFSWQPTGLAGRLLDGSSAVVCELAGGEMSAIRPFEHKQKGFEHEGQPLFADDHTEDLLYFLHPPYPEPLRQYRDLLDPKWPQSRPPRFRFAAFAHAGQRSLGQYQLQAIQEQKDNPLADACVFERSAHTAQLVQWIANTKAKAAFAKVRNDQEAALQREEAVAQVERAVAEVIGSDFSFQLIEDPLDVQAVVGGTLVPLDVLPDGLKSIMSWVTDILMRMDRVRWEDDVPVLQRPFLLFLDEIELHLHPAWQRKVLPMVHKLFPKAQIFIATHSPFVLASADGAWIHPLRLDGRWAVAEEPVRAELGRSYATVLSEVLGVEHEFDIETEKLFEDFYDLKRGVLAGKAKIEDLQAVATKLRERSAETAAIVVPELGDLRRRLDAAEQPGT